MNPPVLFLAALGALGAFAACGQNPAPSRPHDLSAVAQWRAELQARATNFFETVIVHKPAEIPGAQKINDLAPLFLFETQARLTNAAAAPPPPFQVIVRPQNVELNHVLYQQFTWLVLPQNLELLQAAAKTPRWFGIRLTLARNGLPVLWELLPAAPGQRRLYASLSLEQQAARQHGPALAGRRFALEPAAAHQPGLVLVRVLDDGPVPMGPLVYLDAAGEVATLLCRCMPAQAKAAVTGQNYSLRLWNDELAKQLETANEAALAQLATQLSQPTYRSELETMLRLPTTF